MSTLNDLHESDPIEKLNQVQVSLGKPQPLFPTPLGLIQTDCFWLKTFNN